MAGETPLDLDFGTGDRSKWSGLEAADVAYQWIAETSTKRIATRTTGRFRERSTDIWSGNNTIRSLVNRLDTHETSGQEYYYSGSFFIPTVNSAGAANTVGANLLWELHHPASLYNLASLGVAPFALHIESNGAGNFKLQFRIATGNGIVGSGWTYWEPNIDISGTNPLPKGQWIDWLVHISFTEASTGKVEVWVDPTGSAAFSGAPNVSRTNIPTLPFCNSAGVHNVQLYMEHGLYTGGTNLAGGSDPTDLISDGVFRRLTKSDAIIALTGGTGGGGGGGSSGTWGITTVGSLQVDYGSPFISVNKMGNIPAGKTYRLSNARSYQRGGFNVTGSGDVKLVVWTVDTSGAVSAAVVVDVATGKHFVADASVPANRSPVAGWQTYVLEHSPLDLAGGASGKDVYVGFINQGTGGAAQLYYDHAAAGTETYKSDARYTTLADGNTFGTIGGTSDAAYSTAIDWLDVSAAAPANTTLPSITGVAHTGNVVTADNGLWTNSPTGFAYQWKRDGVNIGGATAQTYTILTADVGHNLTVAVTATNASGNATATSSAIVPSGVAAPVSDGPPSISGTAIKNSTLVATTGVWENAPTTYVYQWLRNGVPIDGASSSTYHTSADDIGAILSIQVTASNSAGQGISISSGYGPILDIAQADQIAIVITVPHFDLPFRLVGDQFGVAEQDSEEDVSNCVEAILRTPYNQIPDTPDFGLDDHTFDVQPLDTNAITHQIMNQEPRASLLITQATDFVDNLIARLKVIVGEQ